MLATHSENNCIRCVLDGWIALVSKWFQLFLKIATDIRCIKNDHNSSANLLMSCCMTCWEYPLSELEHFHVNQLFYGQSSLHDYEKTHLSTHVETKGRGEDALKHMKQYYPNVKQIAISEHQLSNLCFSEPTKIIFAMHSVSLSEGVIHTSIPVVESKPLEGDGICFEYLHTVD